MIYFLIMLKLIIAIAGYQEMLAQNELSPSVTDILNL